MNTVSTQMSVFTRFLHCSRCECRSNSACSTVDGSSRQKKIIADIFNGHVLLHYSADHLPDPAWAIRVKSDAGLVCGNPIIHYDLRCVASSMFPCAGVICSSVRHLL